MAASTSDGDARSVPAGEPTDPTRSEERLAGALPAAYAPEWRLLELGVPIDAACARCAAAGRDPQPLRDAYTRERPHERVVRAAAEVDVALSRGALGSDELRRRRNGASSAAVAPAAATPGLEGLEDDGAKGEGRGGGAGGAAGGGGGTDGGWAALLSTMRRITLTLRPVALQPPRRASKDACACDCACAEEGGGLLAGAAAEVPVSLDIVANPPPDALWASVWSVSVVLGELLLATDQSDAREPRHPLVHGLRVLDLGSGTGFVALCAARGGAAEVLATDIEPLAVRMAAHNACTCRNGGGGGGETAHAGAGGGDRERAARRCAACSGVMRARRLDWADHDSVRAVAGEGGFDVVCGADVLYIGSIIPALAGALQRALAAAGVAYFVDPGRGHLPAFAEALRGAGLRTRHFRLDGLVTSICALRVCSVLVAWRPREGGDPPAAVAHVERVVEFMRRARCDDAAVKAAATTKRMAYTVQVALEDA